MKDAKKIVEYYEKYRDEFIVPGASRFAMLHFGFGLTEKEKRENRELMTEALAKAETRESLAIKIYPTELSRVELPAPSKPLSSAPPIP